MNKLDVVDVDPESSRVYGTTWFTVFSPKIDTYTIGVEPGDGLGLGPFAGTTVNWVPHPRSGRPGIVRRKYAVHVDGATSTTGWRTYRFRSGQQKRSRRTGRPIGKPLGFEIQGRRLRASDLTHPPGDRAKVIGTFPHDLPIPVLTDCVAFYAGQAYPLPGEVIVRGEPVRLVLDQGNPPVSGCRRRGNGDAPEPRAVVRGETRSKAAQKQQLTPSPDRCH